MSTSFLDAVNTRTRHTILVNLSAAWRREPHRMTAAATRYVANFDQHRPRHFNDFWLYHKTLYNYIQDEQLAKIHILNSLVSRYGSSGFFDFAIYPVRGIVHALNRIKRWISRAKQTVRVRRRQRLLRIRQGNYINLLKEMR